MRYPTLCNQVGCANDAVSRGRCAAHPLKAWASRSRSSATLNGQGRSQHRAARRRATRASKRCARCGHEPLPGEPALALHHPEPISRDGAIVQAEARLLCELCHPIEDREALRSRT